MSRRNTRSSSVTSSRDRRPALLERCGQVGEVEQSGRLTGRQSEEERHCIVGRYPRGKTSPAHVPTAPRNISVGFSGGTGPLLPKPLSLSYCYPSALERKRLSNRR